MKTPDFCQLPITDQRRKYVPSHMTDIRKTFAEHEPIHVCPAYGDDYQREQIETAACEQQEGGLK